MGRPNARAPRVVGDDTVRDDADADGDAPSARAASRTFHAPSSRARLGWLVHRHATRRARKGAESRLARSTWHAFGACSRDSSARVRRRRAVRARARPGRAVARARSVEGQ